MKFIHLTDPHLIEGDERLFGVDVKANLVAAVASINAKHADAELCVLTGDLTHWGQHAAFEDLRSIMNDLAMPWYPILGNHDDRDVFRQVFADAPDDGNGFVQYTLDTSAGRFVLLDTLEAGTAGGVLCRDRLDWLKVQLDAARRDGVAVYLFMHHAPMMVGIARLDRIALQDPDAFAEIVNGNPDIRHLFFGHLHRACHGSWRGIPFSTLKATAHQMALDTDPQAPLTCSLENPAYAVVLIGTDGVVVHDHSFLEESRVFEYDRGVPDGAVEPPAHQREWD